ncbi:hypothetical protein Tco_0226238, partial [Tanacetum coccineum]
RVAVVASGGVESRVRESDGGDRIDREMGRIFGVGRKSSPENFSGGCGGGRLLPDIWEGEEGVMRECVYAFSDSLLLTPLCCDDIHDVTPRVSALAGCDTQEAKDIYEVINRDYSTIPIPARRDIDNPDELCKTEEFTVVRHSIGNDEEFVAVGPSKINTVERTSGSMSCIYHELFNRKDRGWEVTRRR